MSVRYTLAESTLGRVLVAASERGVCVVFLGARDEALVRALREELPRAQLARDDEGLAAQAGAVVARIEGGEGEVLLDVQGTAFQREVWSALTRIPRGETRSYRRIAEELGRPSAARAVGRACATNRLAVLIPCHRMRGEDGTMTRYRWGVARKRRLLERESR